MTGEQTLGDILGRHGSTNLSDAASKLTVSDLRSLQLAFAGRDTGGSAGPDRRAVRAAECSSAPVLLLRRGVEQHSGPVTPRRFHPAARGGFRALP